MEKDARGYHQIQNLEVIINFLKNKNLLFPQEREREKIKMRKVEGFLQLEQ